ncbi:helix-turn-helix domain-containing protein [Actinocorallia lasiicapitis]
MNPENDEFLTAKQLMSDLGVSRSTFYRWRATGRGPRLHRLPNRQMRFLRSEVIRWIESLPNN